MMRKPLPDLMKGLAIIFMVQVHLMELLATEEIFLSLTGSISLFIGGPFAAPVFMAVMGYFLAASRRTHSSKIIRGLGLITIGLLLNIGMNLHLLIRSWSSIDPWRYVFGADILWMAGLSIIFITLLSRGYERKYYWYIITAAVMALLSDLAGLIQPPGGWVAYIAAFFWGATPWSYFPLLPWMAYPLAGYGFYLFVADREESFYRIQRHKFMIFVVLALLVVITSGYAFSISVKLEKYYHHGILFFFWTMFFLPAWMIVLEYLHTISSESLTDKYIRWLGRNVTRVYIIQWLIIGNLATALYKTQFLIQLTGWFLIIMLITSLLVRAMEKRRQGF